MVMFSTVRKGEIVVKELELSKQTPCLIDPKTGTPAKKLRYVDVTEECPGVTGRCTIFYVQTVDGPIAHLWVQRYPGNEPSWRNFSAEKPAPKRCSTRRTDTPAAWEKWFRARRYVFTGPTGYLPKDPFGSWARWVGLTKEGLRSLILNNRPQMN